MKETQKQHLLRLFREGQGKLMLRDIVGTTLSCEYRARMCELRKAGYGIEFIRGKKPMENTYLLYKEPQPAVEKKKEIKGVEQCALAFD